MKLIKSGYGLILVALLATGISMQATPSKPTLAVGTALTLGMGFVYFKKYFKTYRSNTFPPETHVGLRNGDASEALCGAGVLTTLVGGLWYMLLKK